MPQWAPPGGRRASRRKDLGRGSIGGHVRRSASGRMRLTGAHHCHTSGLSTSPKEQPLLSPMEGVMFLNHSEVLLRKLRLKKSSGVSAPLFN